MAIQLDLTQSNFGVPFQGAYFRIVTAAISRQRQDDPRHSVMIDVVGYATQPANEDTKDVDFRRYHTPLVNIEAQPATEFIAKCYQWVMTQADMGGSGALVADDDALNLADYVPVKVTMRQARLALLAANLLETVDAAIAAGGEADKIEWEYATEVRRDSPLVANMTAALGLTAEQVDGLFRQAATL